MVLLSGMLLASAYVESYLGSLTDFLSSPVRPVYSVIILRALNYFVTNSHRSAPGELEVCLTISSFAFSAPACRRFSATSSTGSASEARSNCCLSAVVVVMCGLWPPVA